MSEHEVILSLAGVSVDYGRGNVLEDINLEVHRGDFIAITGPNGGGKTTLLRVMLGLLKPAGGNVSVSDKLSIGYLPQKNAIDSQFPITVEEVVASGLPHRKSILPHRRTAAEREALDRTLATVGMTEVRRKGIGELSGGQLQRTLLGRAIISRPALLVLDEPLSYVDKAFEKHLYEVLAAIAEHTTIVLVSHEMSEISKMANRHIIIDHSVHECTAHHHFVQTECRE